MERTANNDTQPTAEEVVLTTVEGFLDEKGSLARLSALKTLQKELRTRTAEVTEHVMKSVILDRLMEIVVDNDALQEELIIATEIVNNLAACTRDSTLKLVDMHVIPAMIHLCKTSTTVEILEHAVWTLGNIAGEAVDVRDLVIAAGAADVILELIQTHETQLGLQKICVWAASNLPRGRGSWPNELLKFAPIMTKKMLCNEKEMMVDALWTLSFLACEGPTARQRALVEVPDLVPNAIKILHEHDTTVVLIPTMRLVGNLLAGDENTADVVLDAGAIQAIAPKLTHLKSNVQREASWALSNVFCGNASQIRKALLAEILNPLLEIIYDNYDSDVVREAQWCIGNMVTGCASKDFAFICKAPHFFYAIQTLIANNDTSLGEFGITGALRLFAWFEKALHWTDEGRPFVECMSKLADTIQGRALSLRSAAELYETFLRAPRQPSQEWVDLGMQF